MWMYCMKLIVFISIINCTLVALYAKYMLYVNITRSNVQLKSSVNIKSCVDYLYTYIISKKIYD